MSTCTHGRAVLVPAVVAATLACGAAVGLVLAAFLFMRRMANVTKVSFLTQSSVEEEENPDDPMAPADEPSLAE